MSPQADRVLLDALRLSPLERADLIEKLLASFPFPDKAATHRVQSPVHLSVEHARDPTVGGQRRRG